MEYIRFLLFEQMMIEVRAQRAKKVKLKTIEHIKADLLKAEEMGDVESETGILIHLGNLYARDFEFQFSDIMYRRALALARQIPNPYLETIALINLGLSFKERMDFTQAYSNYHKALKIARNQQDKIFEQKILEHVNELIHMIDFETLSQE